MPNNLYYCSAVNPIIWFKGTVYSTGRVINNITSNSLCREYVTQE